MNPKKDVMTTAMRRNQATRGKNELRQVGNDGIESMSQFPETWREIIT